MAAYDNATFEILDNPMERKENPQMYANTPFAYVHSKPARHVKGLVGGNEVSLPRGNMVDVESDLLGLNIPLTKCPQREYQPPPQKQSAIIRNNTKGRQVIDVRPRHLKPMQMFPLNAVFAPIPMVAQQCGRPEKY
jgi:hypothetical protein